MSETRFPSTTDATFESEVLRGAKPTIVGFWASWAAPCDLMASAYGELIEQFGELVNVVALNVDDSPLTPSNLEIDTLPTMVLFKEGVAISRVEGASSRTQLQRLFEEAIALN